MSAIADFSRFGRCYDASLHILPDAIVLRPTNHRMHLMKWKRERHGLTWQQVKLRVDQSAFSQLIGPASMASVALSVIHFRHFLRRWWLRSRATLVPIRPFRIYYIDGLDRECRVFLL